MMRFTELSVWLTESSFGHSLVDQMAKATIVLLFAWGISSLLRRASAAARHQLWATALLAILALPFLASALPSWRVAILPAEAALAGSASTEAAQPLQHGEVPAGAALAELRTTNAAPAQAQTATPVQRETTAQGETTASSGYGVSLQWIFLAWALGASLFLARLLISALAARKLVSESIPVTDAGLQAEVATLCRQLGIHSRVHVVEHPRLSMPMAWGLVRQTVLLPIDARSWTEGRRRVVLLHELAHLKRWDCQTLLLARLVTALHWFNPLVWVAVRRLQAEREHACDDLVLTAGTPGSDYAQHLLDIARAMKSSLSPGWAMVAMARPSELEGRLLAILDPHLERVRTTRIARLGILAIALMVLPLAVLQPRASAQQEATDRPFASSLASSDTTASTAENTTDTSSSKSTRLIEAFSVALEDDDPEIRAQAARSLGSLEDTAATALLEAAMRDDASAKVREQAAWALGMIESDAAVQALAGALADSSADVRQQAAWALGMIDSDQAVPQLRQTLVKDEPEVREQAAWALGMIESDTATPELIQALTDEDRSVRKQAAWALGMIEGSSAVEALASALATDTSPAVREQAAWALGMIGDKAALDTLLDAMTDDHPEVRKQALWAVGQISNH